MNKTLHLLLFLIPFCGSAQDISGSWFWQGENGEILMEITLKAEGAEYAGHHCSVFQFGDRIDCVDETEPASIRIKRTAKNVFEGKIRSGYSASEGLVKMTFNPIKKILLFEILEGPIDIYYLPKKAIFKSSLGREQKPVKIDLQSKTTAGNQDSPNQLSPEALRSTENSTDTLFFKLDESYFQKGKYDENLLYIKDALKDEGSSETFLFKIMERRSDIAPPKKIKNFQRYIKSSDFFNEEKKVNKLRDYRLASHLQNYTIFLVDLNSEPPTYVRVYPLTEIE